MAGVPARYIFPARGGLAAGPAALDPREFATILVTTEGKTPRLTVVSRAADHSQDIHTGHRSCRWAWAEPIAATNDPLTAARQVTDLLRAAPQPAHDW